MEVRWPGGDRHKPALSGQELRAQLTAGVMKGPKHKGCECQIEGEKESGLRLGSRIYCWAGS